LSGNPAVGSILTCNPGTWSGSPAPAIGRSWLADGQPIVGADGTTYAVQPTDAGKQLACRESASNAGGSGTATSDALTIPVPTSAPQNTAKPRVSGSATSGSTLTCSPGTWTGTPTPTLTYAWLTDGRPIVGATTQTYPVKDGDRGKQITCRETAANSAGSAAATSDPVSVPDAPPPTPQEERLAEAPQNQVATAFGLPSAKQCLSRRRFPLRVKQPPGVTIAKVSITLNNKRLKVRKADGRFRTVVDLRGLPKGRFTVKIVVTTRSGKTIRGARRYKTCTKRERNRNRSPV
jgi:hypothetical protein